jgi:phosphoribosylaminoimidazole-succinocarboxamide synthase
MLRNLYGVGFMPSKDLCEGKTKIIKPTDDHERVILHFKDDVTGGDGAKHDVLVGKGRVNATISARLLKLLEENGIKTHFIDQMGSNQLIAKKLMMIPIEVVCRILAAGHLVGIGKYFQYRQKLNPQIVEFYLKDDTLHDPMLNRYHIRALGLAVDREISEMEDVTLRASNVLEKFLSEREMLLADFKLEFGRDDKGKIIVGDELSTDSMRLWDKSSFEILDKDRFRKDMPQVIELAYLEPLRRICGVNSVPG